MKLKIIFLLMLPLIFSCGKNHNIDASNGSASLVIEKIEDANLNDQSISSIKISDSSSKLQWPNEWTSELADVLSEPHFESIYNLSINKYDLEIVKCEKFNELSNVEKKIFYIVYLASIAEAESDYDIKTKSFNRSDRTLNIGLFQIDLASAHRHAREFFTISSDNDLIDPKLNIAVAAHILKNQLNSKAHKGRLFPVKSYYWQVLTKRTRVLNTISRNRKNIKFCD